MSTLLRDDQIALAYNLLREWEDEEPRQFGVEFRSAAVYRDGSGAYHEAVHGNGDWAMWAMGAGDEDALIEHIDHPDEPDDDEEEDCDTDEPSWSQDSYSKITDESDDPPPGKTMRDEPVPSSRGYSPTMTAVGMGRSHARVHHRQRVVNGLAA